MDTEYVPGSTITESQGDEPGDTEYKDPIYKKQAFDPEALVAKDYSVLEVVPIDPLSVVEHDHEDEDDSDPNKKEGPMICPKCNHPNPSYIRLCIKCGTDLEKKTEENKAVPKVQEQIVKKPVSGVIEK